MRFGKSALGLGLGTLLLGPVVSLAAPIVTSTSGTVADGASLTISGTGFGSKSPAKPWLWAPMDTSSTPSPLGIVTSWKSISMMRYAADCGAGGGGCLQGDPSDGVNTNNWTAAIVSPSTTDWNSYGQETYVYRKSKKTFDFDSSKNVKTLRMWGMNDAGDITFPNFYWSMGNGRFGVEGVPVPYADYTMPTATLAIAKGTLVKWYTEEMSLKSNSSSDAADADFRIAVNGGPYLVQFPNTQWMLNGFKIKTDSGYRNDGRMRILFAVHEVVEGSDGWVPTTPGNQYWADDVYVDTTWSRVMIGDSPVFNNCTAREIQIPTAWSGSSISVVVNTKAFPAGKPKYLFVVDQTGVASPDLLLDGNTVRPKAPSATVN